jgi:CRISPR-associated protein Cas2
MKVYLVCYDITDDNIRLGVSKILGEYGERVQYSVFEVVLHSNTELERLQARLKGVLGDAPNDLRFYLLCSRCRAESRTLSGKKIASFPSHIIV